MVCSAVRTGYPYLLDWVSSGCTPNDKRFAVGLRDLNEMFRRPGGSSDKETLFELGHDK